MEDGRWKMEVGSWKMDVGRWNAEISPEAKLKGVLLEINFDFFISMKTLLALMLELSELFRFFIGKRIPAAGTWIAEKA